MNTHTPAVARFPYAAKALELTTRAQRLQEQDPAQNVAEILACLEQVTRLAERFTATWAAKGRPFLKLKKETL